MLGEYCVDPHHLTGCHVARIPVILWDGRDFMTSNVGVLSVSIVGWHVVMDTR